MIRNKKLKNYLEQKGFLKLPMFRKIIIITAPNGETISRDFFVEEKVVNVLSVSNSPIIPDAIHVETTDYDVHIVVTDSFDDAKTSLSLLAEKEQVSLFWVDKEMLEIDDGESEEVLADAFTIEGLRKWVYCPVISDSYNEWVEYSIKDINNDEAYSEDVSSVKSCSDINFQIRDLGVLPTIVKQQYSIDVDDILADCEIPVSIASKQMMCAMIIVIQSINEERIETSKLGHRLIQTLRMSDEAKIFCQYYVQTMNWDTLDLYRDFEKEHPLRVQGLVEFIKSLNPTSDDLESMQQQFKELLHMSVQIIESLPGLQFSDGRSQISIDKRKWIINTRASTHFDNSTILTGESPEYIGDIVKQISSLELKKKSAVAAGDNFYQCSKCSFLQNKSGSCESCGSNELVRRLPASIKNHRYTIQDAIRTLK